MIWCWCRTGPRAGPRAAVFAAAATPACTVCTERSFWTLLIPLLVISYSYKWSFFCNLHNGASWQRTCSSVCTSCSSCWHICCTLPLSRPAKAASTAAACWLPPSVPQRCATRCCSCTANCDSSSPCRSSCSQWLRTYTRNARCECRHVPRRLLQQQGCTILSKNSHACAIARVVLYETNDAKSACACAPGCTVADMFFCCLAGMSMNGHHHPTL
jgi:hypothetical protein